MFSRGCCFSCRFCACQPKKVRFRTGKNIRSELEFLKEKYGIKGFSTVDDNSIINKEILYNICDCIKDLNLKWNTLSRVDMVEYDKLKVMRESGCIEIKYGIESGSQKILDLMDQESYG